MKKHDVDPVLEVTGLGIDFGGLTAVDDFSFVIYPGEIRGLIGPNGAGKTTVFNMLTKVYEPSRGSIVFDHKSTKNMNVMEVNRAGIARTFQNIRLFSKMSVLDNVRTGMNSRVTYGNISAILRLPSFRKQEKEIRERSMELLQIFGLEGDATLLAGNLPYGAQRRLEMARAMATDPKLLLLDEPAAGMNPQETEELMDMVRSIRDRFGIAILLIEHDMKLVMGICERITVLNYGMVLAEGTPAEIQNDAQVIKAYLGD